MTPGDHQVRLYWKWEPGDPGINPELFVDHTRKDGVLRDFERYRLYRSTQGRNGPWTLLGEWDREDNQYGYNTGLQYEYIDRGLINGIPYYYSVVSYDIPDTVSGFESQESSIGQNLTVVYPGAQVASIGKVSVVPNPYRGDVDYNAAILWEPPKDPRRNYWIEEDRRIQFINLPPRCTIRIHTLAGDLVATIKHDNPGRNYEDWNLTSLVNQAVRSRWGSL